MFAAYTSTVSVQVSGFEDIGLLTHRDRLIGDSCSSSQRFAFGFLQIPPHDGHPCRSANRSPCRADSGLAPPSYSGPPSHVPEQRQLWRYAWRTQAVQGAYQRLYPARPELLMRTAVTEAHRNMLIVICSIIVRSLIY